MPIASCVDCRGLGWVLYGSAALDAAMLEVLPCRSDECIISGREIDVLSVNRLDLDHVEYHPQQGCVMMLSRAETPGDRHRR